MLIRVFSQDVLLETQPHRSLADVIVDVELRKRIISKEWQNHLGTLPIPKAELLPGSSGQLGFEAGLTAIPGTNNVERDIEADGRHQCIFRETLWLTPMTPRQLPFELSKEIVDSQLMNYILRDDKMTRLPSLGMLPVQQHEMLPQRWTSTIMRSAGLAGSESTVSAPIIATQYPDLPIFLELKVNTCLPLPVQYSRCKIHSNWCPISVEKCERQVRGSGRGDLLLNRIRGGGDLQCQTSGKATEDSFTTLPQFRPYLQFPESAVRFENPGLRTGIEPNAGSDIEHPIEIHDDIAEHLMADITPSPEYTSHIDVRIKNRSQDSSPPDMTRATSARTDSRDAGEIDEHTRLGYSTDDHSNRSDKLVARTQRVVEKDTCRNPNPSCPADFQNFADQKAQPSDPHSGPENLEFRSQIPSIANTPDYMILPANAVGPPLHFEDAGCRRRQYGPAPSRYDAICSDAQQAAHGHTTPLSLELPPLNTQNCHLMLDRSPLPDQLQQVMSGPAGLNEQHHRPVAQDRGAVPHAMQLNFLLEVPRPQHHTLFPVIPYSPDGTPTISNPVYRHSPFLDLSTAACAGPGFCMLPAPHAHYTPQNVLPKPLTIGDIVDFSTTQSSLLASNPQTHAQAIGLYQAQQNAELPNVTRQLQRQILPAPQNTSRMPQQPSAPYAFRPRGLLRSQVVTPQMYPTLNPSPLALPPQNDSSGVLRQGRTRCRSRGRGRWEILDSRDPPASHTLGYSAGNFQEVKRVSVLGKGWVRGRSRKTRRVRAEGRKRRWD